MLFLSLFLSADLNAIMEEPIGVIVIILIPTGLLDLGLVVAIEGWKRRRNASTFNPGTLNINNPPGVSTDGGMTPEQQKTIQAISGGISAFSTIYLWIQRLVSVAAAAIAILGTGFWWFLSILDVASGKASPGGALMLVLGFVLINYIAIGYFMLLRKPRANMNVP
jgi:hypothetical protein